VSLAPGTRLGPYEITGQIGVGGMGEVWCATDTNLGRQVAIKILPDAFAQDPERLARFEREARTLASLNHPNIAQIYGLEKTDGIRALVMELVEGPTLADRIAPGPIPVDEALPIMRNLLPTAGGWPMSRTSPVGMKSTCGLSRMSQPGSGRSPRAAARGLCGHGTGRSSSTSRWAR
jgi:serine/threonine protein kinase